MSDYSGAATNAYHDGPVTLIFADDAAVRDVSAAAARAMGGRISAQLPLEEALDRMTLQVSLDTVLLDLARDGGARQDRLLDDINKRAHEGRIAAVVAMPAAMIDAVAARIDHPAVALLCDPTPVERNAAIGFAYAERKYRLNDISGVDAEADRLRQLGEEVGRIARALVKLSGVEERGGAREPTIGYRADPSPGAVDAAAVRGLIRRRRLRDQFFDAALFADPAWDMLLDLTAARLEGRQVAVSSLCIAAAVPATTALRWIGTMSEAGLFRREADPEDGRRVFIALSDKAMAGMTGYFEAVAGS
jgi:CheY-like chemotaxis protein